MKHLTKIVVKVFTANSIIAYLLTAFLWEELPKVSLAQAARAEYAYEMNMDIYFRSMVNV